MKKLTKSDILAMKGENKPNYNLAAALLDNPTDAQIAEAKRLVTKGVNATPYLKAALSLLGEAKPAKKQKPARRAAAVVKATPAKPAKRQRAPRGKADEMLRECLDKLSEGAPLTDDELNRLGNYVWAQVFRYGMDRLGLHPVAKGIASKAKALFYPDATHDINAAVRAGCNLVDQREEEYVQRQLEVEID